MMDQENVSEPVLAITCLDDNDVEPLSGKPFFHTTMGKSHLSSSFKMVPKDFSALLPARATVPVIVTRGSRSWEMKYTGNHVNCKRIGSGWKTFVDDNMLKIGDVCLFELISCEPTLIKFKIQVLRGELPSALLDREATGSPGTQDAPLVINID